MRPPSTAQIYESTRVKRKQADKLLDVAIDLLTDIAVMTAIGGDAAESEKDQASLLIISSQASTLIRAIRAHRAPDQPGSRVADREV